jgi:hypothetical protein
MEKSLTWLYLTFDSFFHMLWLNLLEKWGQCLWLYCTYSRHPRELAPLRISRALQRRISPLHDPTPRSSSFLISPFRYQSNDGCYLVTWDEKSWIRPMLNITCCISFISSDSALTSCFLILFCIWLAMPTRPRAFSFREFRSWNAVVIYSWLYFVFSSMFFLIAWMPAPAFGYWGACMKS